MSRPPKPRRSERGATLVEASVATPVFFLLLFAVIELGFLSLSDLTTTNASRVGARSAGVHNAHRIADFEILSTVENALGSLGLHELDYVVVYRVDEVGDDMNPLCHTQPVSLSADPDRACNRYLPSDLALDYFQADGVTETSHFGCGASAVDRFWCPADRQTLLSGDLDLIGVHIQTTHHYVTGFIGTTQDLSAKTVVQVEPSDT